MREEEDDEEGAVAAPTARSSDARRGSRSEGRLHLARPAQLADNLTKVSARNDAADQHQCARNRCLYTGLRELVAIKSIIFPPE